MQSSVDCCDGRETEFTFWLRQDLSRFNRRVANLSRGFLVNLLIVEKNWKPTGSGNFVSERPNSPEYSLAGFPLDQILMGCGGVHSMESHSYRH